MIESNKFTCTDAYASIHGPMMYVRVYILRLYRFLPNAVLLVDVTWQSFCFEQA